MKVVTLLVKRNQVLGVIGLVLAIVLASSLHLTMLFAVGMWSPN
jgi:hypothetical protein